MSNTVPSSKDEEVRDVLAAYGAAAYQVQALERQVAIVLSTVLLDEPNRVTQTDYDVILEGHFEKTFGRLVEAVRSARNTAFAIDPGLVEELSSAVRTRNFLIHSYFWERAAHFMTTAGRRSMCEELESMALTFFATDAKLTDLSRQWARARGVTDEDIQLEFEALLATAPQDN